MDSVSGLLKQNYEMAVRMLEVVQRSSVDLLHEIGTVTHERPHAVLSGYTRLTDRFAVGAPQSAKIALQPVGAPPAAVNGFQGFGAAQACAFLVEPTGWMTLEGFISVPSTATVCTLEIDLRSAPPREVLIDTFLRASDVNGATIVETPLRTVRVGQPGLVVVTHDIGEDVATAPSVRFIASIREPKGRLELHRCNLLVL